ncbi:MAG: TetR/AcrR family transcriptional regulator [Bacteroidales bacterium]|nr:TetR/AcrR family transcriptional regulator [Bacteroidales bacterium]
MVSKTRERLIEVARQLFARNGVEHTTMLDIANASEKGRRTLYTYFKNKREIHQAVIEHESEQIVAQERQIQNSAISATNKLEGILRARLGVMLTTRPHRLSEPLSLIHFLDGNRSGKTKRLAAEKELDILQNVLREGIEGGEFDFEQTNRLAPLIILLLHSLDNPVAKDNLEILGYTGETAYDRITAFIMNAVKYRPTAGTESEIRNQKSTID